MEPSHIGQRVHGGSQFNPSPPKPRRRHSCDAVLEGAAMQCAEEPGPRTRRMRRSAEAILQDTGAAKVDDASINSSRRRRSRRASSDVDNLVLPSGHQLGLLGGSLTGLFEHEEEERPLSSPSKLGRQPLDFTATMRKHGYYGDLHEEGERPVSSPSKLGRQPLDITATMRKHGYYGDDAQAPASPAKRGRSSSLELYHEKEKEEVSGSPTSIMSSKLGRVADERGYVLRRAGARCAFPAEGQLATLRALHYMRHGSDAPLPRHLAGALASAVHSALAGMHDVEELP